MHAASDAVAEVLVFVLALRGRRDDQLPVSLSLSLCRGDAETQLEG